MTLPDLRVLAYQKGYAINLIGNRINIYAVYVDGANSTQIDIGDLGRGCADSQTWLNALPDKPKKGDQNA